MQQRLYGGFVPAGGASMSNGSSSTNYLPHANPSAACYSPCLQYPCRADIRRYIPNHAVFTNIDDGLLSAHRSDGAILIDMKPPVAQSILKANDVVAAAAYHHHYHAINATNQLQSGMVRFDGPAIAAMDFLSSVPPHSANFESSYAIGVTDHHRMAAIASMSATHPFSQQQHFSSHANQLSIAASQSSHATPVATSGRSFAAAVVGASPNCCVSSVAGLANSVRDSSLSECRTVTATPALATSLSISALPSNSNMNCYGSIDKASAVADSSNNLALNCMSIDVEINPRELENFAEHFKQRRIKLGVTQADVGKALANLKLPGVGSLSQSTICRFESLTLSHNNMIALKPILAAWLEQTESIAKSRRREEATLGVQLCATSGAAAFEKKRKRTSIGNQEKRSLEAYFQVQPRPSGEKISAIAEKLDLKKNVVRVWFCNQRQKQKRCRNRNLISHFTTS